MKKQEYMNFHQMMCNRMIEITKQKNADYSGSGSDPFSNFRQIGSLIQQKGVVEIGFLTRMSDKFSRIGSFISKGTLQVKEETIEDTLLDLANYCILFAGYLRSKRMCDTTSFSPPAGSGGGGSVGPSAEGWAGSGDQSPIAPWYRDKTKGKPRSDLSSQNGMNIP